MSIWTDQQSELFDTRYRNWLRIRAELADFECEYRGDDYDDRFSAIDQKLEDAARLAITTHAIHSHQVWQKFAILDDYRPVWMVGAIKANIAALGIMDVDRRKAASGGADVD